METTLVIRQPRRSMGQDERRERIVEAARDCIALSGIHGAAMAEIAERAELGVGQVYRIFESKEALIAQIANEDLAEMRAMLDALDGGAAGLLDEICALVPQSIDRCFDTRRVALRTELAAEAARNPRVAGILQAVDRQGRAAFEELMSALRRSGETVGDFRARCEFVHVLFDGLAVRSINHPQADRAILTRLVQMTLRRLFA
ncbi:MULTISPECIES: TetR/AcrR family transcriptional regulator [Caulobacter]|uniref:AcrR family transcriptional regulator n=1 Tax=Caulobacter rhizosphaerae TaxID=2010972 RepID=A0ABU1N2U6_9CAUL|nr:MULTISPECIES: TetR/AcrR family transcriptional regulator [Caulobacter]MDR6532769.1 AcrR family transcriptional regulator [Caulobacter rhizosphaerae]